MRPGVRLGCLPYLNVKPLIYPFEYGPLPEGWNLIYEPPSVLAKLLHSGEVDVAPVSSFACLASSELSIAPGICISSDGPVDTVLMLSKVPAEEVKTVAADTSSLSGRSLLKIVLAENYGMNPDFISYGPDVPAMLGVADAALIIGNPAMLADKTGLHVADLGQEWKKLTGLPAVFAVWAGKPEGINAELIAALHQAKEMGLQKIEEICTAQSRALGVPYEVCEDYLTRIMKYDLGERRQDYRALCLVQ